MVNEAIANGDTTYNKTATVNAFDSLIFPTPGSGTIYGIQVVTQARKTDAGVANQVASIKVAGSEYFGQTRALSTTYTFPRQVWDTAPSSSGAWTQSTLTTPEIGYKKI